MKGQSKAQTLMLKAKMGEDLDWDTGGHLNVYVCR